MQNELAWLQSLPFGWFVQIGMSVICGAIIGLERELLRKAAGLRTNVMICFGSTLYVLSADLLLHRFGADFGGDPTRIAGQVVVGMGFIGAGTIMQSRGRVHGLTTAATMWVVAAIGVISGIGYPIFALITTIFVLILLVSIGKLEFFMMGKCKLFGTRLSFREDQQTWIAIRDVATTHNQKIEEYPLVVENGVCFMDLSYCYVHPDHTEFFLDLLKIPDVRQTRYKPTHEG